MASFQPKLSTTNTAFSLAFNSIDPKFVDSFLVGDKTEPRKRRLDHILGLERHPSEKPNMYVKDGQIIVIPPLLQLDSDLVPYQVWIDAYMEFIDVAANESTLAESHLPDTFSKEEKIKALEIFSIVASDLAHPTRSLIHFAVFVAVGTIINLQSTVKDFEEIIKSVGNELIYRYKNRESGHTALLGELPKIEEYKSSEVGAYLYAMGYECDIESIVSAVDSIILLSTDKLDPRSVFAIFASFETEKVRQGYLKRFQNFLSNDPWNPLNNESIKFRRALAGYHILTTLHFVKDTFCSKFVDDRSTDSDKSIECGSKWAILSEDNFLWRFVGYQKEIYDQFSDADYTRLVNQNVALPFSKYNLPFIISTLPYLEKFKDRSELGWIDDIVIKSLNCLFEDPSEQVTSVLIEEITLELLKIINNPLWSKLKGEFCNKSEFNDVLSGVLVDHITGVNPTSGHQSPLVVALNFLKQTNDLPAAAVYLRYSQSEYANMEVVNNILHNIKVQRVNFLLAIPDEDDLNSSIWRAFNLLSREDISRENEALSWLKVLKKLTFEDNDLLGMESATPKEIFKTLNKIANRGELPISHERRERDKRNPANIIRFLDEINNTSLDLNIDKQSAQTLANNFLELDSLSQVRKIILSRGDLIKFLSDRLLVDPELTFDVLEDIASSNGNIYGELLKFLIPDEANFQSQFDTKLVDVKPSWTHGFNPNDLKNSQSVFIFTSEKMNRLGKKDIESSSRNVVIVDVGDDKQTTLPKHIFSKLSANDTLVLIDISCIRHSQYYEIRNFCRENGIPHYRSCSGRQQFKWWCRVAAGLETV